MPTYPGSSSGNISSALDDSDVEEQPWAGGRGNSNGDDDPSEHDPAYPANLDHHIFPSSDQSSPYAAPPSRYSSAARPSPSSLVSLPRPGDRAFSTFPLTNPNLSTAFEPGQARYAFGPGLTSAPSSQNYAPRSGTIYSERSLLLGDAPPAYTPSPPSPSSAPCNYQTPRPPNMGRISQSESRGLLASYGYQSVPQDMGGQQDDHCIFTRVGTWRDRVRSRVSSLDGRTCKLIALGALLTLVTIGFLVNSFLRAKNEKRIYVPGGVSGNPPVSKLPALDGDGTRLAYPAFDGEMRWIASDVCAHRQIKHPLQTFKLEFSGSRNVSFLQDVKKNNPPSGRDVRVDGDVVIRRAGDGTPGPALSLEILSNDDLIELDLDWDDVEQRLHVMTPQSIPWPTNGPAESPCVQIRATIWAPPGSVLDSLNVQGVHLGVKLLDNLSIQLNNFARLASTVGTVVAATDGEKDLEQVMLEGAPKSFNLNSRYIEVKAVSSAISGAWPLYDYLGLETLSGPIRAGVEPKEALKDKPRPAILFARSTSGAVELHEPVQAAAAALAMQSQGTAAGATARDILPPRQYGVDLQTMSGSIKGSLAFSQSCRVHSTSGRIDLNLLPVYDKSQTPSSGGAGAGSVLETLTTSGTTVVRVMDALWDDIQTGAYMAPGTQDTPPAGPATPTTTPGTSAAPAIRVLTSSHRTTSAPVHVTYPASWEGGIEAESLTGKIDVSGKGVRIIRRDEQFPGYRRRVLARKGPDNVGGNLECYTTSGRVVVAFSP